ncbi:MAG: hypothetical protein AAGD09_12090 [Cyanobacteria bacterium P01_F01_bin.56]
MSDFGGQTVFLGPEAVAADFSPDIPKSGDIGCNIPQTWGIKGALASVRFLWVKQDENGRPRQSQVAIAPLDAVSLATPRPVQIRGRDGID